MESLGVYLFAGAFCYLASASVGAPAAPSSVFGTAEIAAIGKMTQSSNRSI
jgi:hypothetical protein